MSQMEEPTASSSTAATAGTLLHTYHLNQIRIFDEPKRLFWLGTGVSISDTVHFLAARSPKLAMPNLGGWTGQTVVGAVTTGTHGSGVKFAPLCDFVSSASCSEEPGAISVTTSGGGGEGGGGDGDGGGSGDGSRVLT